LAAFLSTFLSYGFRPFFLFAFSYAAIAMVAWLAWIGLHAADAHVVEMTTAMAPHHWHAHEMIFGYTLAAIAGFFLTAVPNWTGTKPVSGTTLGVLVVAWLAGRAAIWFSTYLPISVVAVLDLSFLPILLVVVVKSLFSRPTQRNLIFVPILVGLLAGNMLVHAEGVGMFDDGLIKGHLLALDTVIVLISVIGGRITPAFTTNALRRIGHEGEDLPQSKKPLEFLSIGSLIALLVADLLVEPGPVTGALAALAAAANLWRQAGWSWRLTLNQPIVWILHLGYLWLVVGMALRALSGLTDGLSETTAMHALTVGAIGTMTLGVMTRAALGHTGRALHASPAVVFGYVAVSVAALIRIVGPALLPQFYNEAMLAAAIVWTAAYAVVAFVFWPILTTPRARVGED